MAREKRKTRLKRKEAEGLFQALLFDGFQNQAEGTEIEAKAQDAFRRLKISDPTAAEVIDKLCGLSTREPMSASDLARLRNVSRSNISRLKQRGLQKLRQLLRI